METTNQRNLNMGVQPKTEAPLIKGLVLEKKGQKKSAPL
jgi:hypothetical protein